MLCGWLLAQGFWVVGRYDDIMEIVKDPENLLERRDAGAAVPDSPRGAREARGNLWRRMVPSVTVEGRGSNLLGSTFLTFPLPEICGRQRKTRIRRVNNNLEQTGCIEEAAIEKCSGGRISMHELEGRWWIERLSGALPPMVAGA